MQPVSRLIEQLEEIKTMLNKISERDDDLWSLEDIARYIKVHKRTAIKLTELPQFPSPIKLPTTENGGHPRWIVGDVKAFIRRYRQSKVP